MAVVTLGAVIEGTPRRLAELGRDMPFAYLLRSAIDRGPRRTGLGPRGDIRHASLNRQQSRHRAALIR
jgi:hypothetical protein